MQQPYIWNANYQNPSPSPNAPDWQAWIQRLYESELRLQQMSAQLADVQKQLDDIKSKPPLHIEYHFDQLKVNRLEGTLNVGISPQGISGIESLETPDPSCWKINSDPPDEAAVPIRNLQAEMSDYMKTNSNAVLLEMERQFGVSLDEEHRRRVVDDVAKQLNERVHYYARSSDYPAQGTEEERDKWKNAIIEKTRRDIRGAFSAYLSNQRQAMKGSDTAP